jgi:uncharacterized membrane protein HdeD (DUF308 family)
MSQQRQYRGAGIVLMVLGVLGIVYGLWIHFHTFLGRGLWIALIGLIFLLLGIYRNGKHNEVKSQNQTPPQTPQIK